MLAHDGHTRFSCLQAVVFDWAGTTVDCGCLGPVQAFVASFAAFGMDVTIAEAREPMGMDKRDHVATMFAMPRIAALWKAKHGVDYTEADIDAVYQHVATTMLSVITQFATPIADVPEAIGRMRARGLKIGSCTGYPRDVAEALAAHAAGLGYVPDCLVSATDVPRARPAGDMCISILQQFGITEPWRTVKVGDTVNDILEGLDAGMWTIGVTDTSNFVGMPASELATLTPEQRQEAARPALEALEKAGAHFIVADVPHCFVALEAIDALCAAGHKP